MKERVLHSIAEKSKGYYLDNFPKMLINEMEEYSR